MVESHIEEVVYFFGLNVDKVPKMLSKHWIFLQNVETKEKPHLKNFSPAITPLYSPVWMNERAECSKNAASLI